MIPAIDERALQDTIATLRAKLLALRGPHGHWEGRLSSSALSTATAVFALAAVDRGRYRSLVDRGLRWLCENQNADGGWGDTVRSPSNLSTTMLCYSALACEGMTEAEGRRPEAGGARDAGCHGQTRLAVNLEWSVPSEEHSQTSLAVAPGDRIVDRGTVGGSDKRSLPMAPVDDGRPSASSEDSACRCHPDDSTAPSPAPGAASPSSSALRSVERAESWLRRMVGTLDPQALARAVESQYGKDRTFSVPILTMCVLAGRLGERDRVWRLVRPLPFELAVLPHRLFKWMRLPVVSYALPALIAIGQVRYKHLKPHNPITRMIRHLSEARTLDVLAALQPPNGGFLEAAPLTSFVVMSLAACGHREHVVVSKGVEFLAASIREDGSWPIDTNLATWVTTLSIGALSAGGLGVPNAEFCVGEPLEEALSPSERQALSDWLLSCQHRRTHPYTQAAPGGWAWSDLPGAVPDADDTAGALIALHELSRIGPVHPIDPIPSAADGIEWLLGLQNADGGIPTFCRGWTKLPFDKSAADITAHGWAAMSAWRHELPDPLRSRTEQAMLRALRYLKDAQRPDGSWVPLWFGNQSAENQENPVYGTSRVLKHLAAYGLSGRNGPMGPMCERAADWLLSAQNTDGGWGGAASVASSTEETALAVDALAAGLSSGSDPGTAAQAVRRGANWLIAHTNQGVSLQASPIGLYFARLWYFEGLYPLVFALSALGKVSRLPAAP